MQKAVHKSAPSSAKVSAAKGSKVAGDAADKVSAALKKMRKAPSMLAMRNRVLDAALARFERRGGWINGYLAVDKEGNELDEIVSSAVEEAHAVQFRAAGASFCAIGGLAAELGNFTHEVIQAAVDAVYESLPEKAKTTEAESYGFARAEAVVTFNDNQSRRTAVVRAFRKAKSQPLRKD